MLDNQELPPLALMQPSQTAFSVGIAELPDGKKFGVLRVESSNGSFVFFMSPELMESLRDGLDKNLIPVRSSLTVATQMPKTNDATGG